MRRRPSHHAIANPSRYITPYQCTAGWNVMPSSENSGNCRAMGSIRWTNGMLTSPRAQSCASLGPQVQALDRRREAHRTVDVTLGHVDFQALDHQVGADQDDEEIGRAHV